MRKKRGIIAYLLSLIMIVTSLPIQTFATISKNILNENASIISGLEINEENGNQYAVIEPDRGVTWKEAEENCQSLGGHLATITSSSENNFIVSLINKNSKKDKKYYWLGGSDEVSEGTWKWVTGENFSYNNWGAKQPDNDGVGQVENYLGILKVDANFAEKEEWNDFTNSGYPWSSSEFGFICEWENNEETEQKVHLDALPQPNSNCVDLEWHIEDINEEYSYMIYQRHITETTEETEYHSIPANDVIKVLQVYPSSGQLVGWVNQYGQGKFQCDAVKITQFNSNPDIVWDYDVVVFGFYDCNGGYDLNANSRDVVEKYINSGAGVLFGHDTINVYLRHTYFDSLAKYANLSLVNFDCPYESSVRVIKKGLLTNYPYEIGDVGKTISTYTSHVSCQIPLGDIWMEFSSSKNFYLTTWNNCAMIQLGHSGSATADEIKLLMNTINYLAQKTTKTSWVDHMGQDLSAPTIPTVLGWNFTNEMSTLNFELSSQDGGDKYQYYVEATNAKTGEKLQSNTAEVELITGVKGYSIVIDNNPDTIPDNTIDTENNQVEMQIPEECDKSNLYIHVKAIDNAGNVSEVLHYICEEDVEAGVFYKKLPKKYDKINALTCVYSPMLSDETEAQDETASDMEIVSNGGVGTTLTIETYGANFKLIGSYSTTIKYETEYNYVRTSIFNDDCICYRIVTDDSCKVKDINFYK